MSVEGEYITHSQNSWSRAGGVVHNAERPSQTGHPKPGKLHLVEADRSDGRLVVDRGFGAAAKAAIINTSGIPRELERRCNQI